MHCLIKNLVQIDGEEFNAPSLSTNFHQKRNSTILKQISSA